MSIPSLFHFAFMQFKPVRVKDDDGKDTVSVQTMAGSSGEEGGERSKATKGNRQKSLAKGKAVARAKQA